MRKSLLLEIFFCERVVFSIHGPLGIPFIGICRRSSGFAAVHRDLPPFIGICNPDALSIRIFNPLKAHYKCLHSMRADCKYWSYGRNTTHRCIYIPWQCSGNRTTGPEHRGRHPCRAWRNRHDDLLLRQWKSIPREPSHD